MPRSDETFLSPPLYCYTARTINQGFVSNITFCLHLILSSLFWLARNINSQHHCLLNIYQYQQFWAWGLSGHPPLHNSLFMRWRSHYYACNIYRGYQTVFTVIVIFLGNEDGNICDFAIFPTLNLTVKCVEEGFWLFICVIYLCKYKKI